MQKRLFFLAIASLGVALVGCSSILGIESLSECERNADGECPEVDAGPTAAVTVTNSTHRDGEQNASISATIVLTFDTPMRSVSFENNVTIRGGVSQDLISNTSYTPAEMQLAIAVPPALLDDGKLMSNTEYEVKITNQVLTSEGIPIKDAINITFKTFEYGFTFDDSAIVNSETWGLVYHAPTDSLFYSGDDQNRIEFVRSFNLSTKKAAEVLNPASTQVMYGGISLYGDTLYVNETYDSEVTPYTINSDGSLTARTPVYSQTTLKAPADSLSEVDDTAELGNTLYFVTGNYHGGASFQDVIQVKDSQAWSVFRSGATLGFENAGAKQLVAVDRASGLPDYVYLAASGKLYRFDTNGDNLIVDFPFSGSTIDLAADSNGNIYAGTSSGVFRYDADLNLLDQRPGVNASRIAIKEVGDEITVFYVGHRRPTEIEFVKF